MVFDVVVDAFFSVSGGTDSRDELRVETTRLLAATVVRRDEVRDGATGMDMRGWLVGATTEGSSALTALLEAEMADSRDDVRTGAREMGIMGLLVGASTAGSSVSRAGLMAPLAERRDLYFEPFLVRPNIRPVLILLTGGLSAMIG